MINDGYGIPEIYEDEANYRLRFIYEDIKFVLKVPIVNFIFRTLAHYEEFLELAWYQIRPNMLTIKVANFANELRHPNISVDIPSIY